MGRVDLRKLRVLFGKLIQHKNRIRRANRDAGAAIDAVVGFDVELGGFGETVLVLLGVDAVHRAGLHTQLVFGTGVCNYIGHALECAIPMPGANRRKQEVKLDNAVAVGGAYHAAVGQCVGRYTKQ